jgi:hypothetical protein
MISNADSPLGKHRDYYMREVFHEVIKLSQKRIYGRLKSFQWKNPNGIHKSQRVPLYSRIERKMTESQSSFSPDLIDAEQPTPLRNPIVALIGSLRSVDGESHDDPLELLKDVVYKSHIVSTCGGSQNLEKHLSKLSPGANQDKEVLEIDKLSKYPDLCHDLIRLSRQPRTRLLCMNIKLETCTAYEAVRPPGALTECTVHGEVQLVLFHERFPTSSPPRAIGSSKSACFLCDLFIKKHGAFGISHSHMTFYPKWRVPDAPWMHSRQVQHFRDILSAMDSEIIALLKRKSFRGYQQTVESRVHILQTTQLSSIAPSTMSPVVSDMHSAINSEAIAMDSVTHG